MPGKARKGRQLARERQQTSQPGAVGIEAGLAHALGDGRAAIPPLHDFGKTAAFLERQPEYLAEIAQRAARAVHDDGGGDRRALAAVLAVDVLQYLLAPLVLEVDVDVGRLVTLARNEALEQQRGATLRIHRSDAQAIAHARIGGRAAPLAEDPLAARESDHIVDGEEV